MSATGAGWQSMSGASHLSNKESCDVMSEVVDSMTIWVDVLPAAVPPFLVNWTRVGRDMRMVLILLLCGHTVADPSQLHLISHQVQGYAEHGDGAVTA